MIFIALMLQIHFGFLLSVLRKRLDVADIGWGVGFPLLMWSLVLESPQLLEDPRSLVLLILTSAWGARLALYIGLRSRGRPEDPRYTKMRLGWAKAPQLQAYLKVFVLQTALMFLIALPLLWSLRWATEGLSPAWGYWDSFGVFLWVIGFGFEVIGDWQLDQFRKNPANKGTIIQSGLWRYTRHPNYFGEITLWWGLFFIAWSGGASLALAGSPALITFLLLKVSGVPLLEKKYEGRPDWEDYKRRTNLLIPWKPRA